MAGATSVVGVSHIAGEPELTQKIIRYTDTNLNGRCQ